jgi:nucleoside-diphosphate-sugar epimerase
VKNILITGVNGFVGSALLNNLSKDYNIIGIGRKKGKFNYSYVYCDLIDSNCLKSAIEILKQYKIDIIIHAASKMSTNENVNEINVLIDNIRLSENVAKITKLLNIPYFINLSSSSVYPNIDGEFSEESNIWPARNTDCFYGLSKFNAENIFTFQLESILNNLLHLRISMIYGDGMNENRIIAVFKNDIIKKNKLTLFGEGKRLVNLIDINSLCKYIKYFIDNPLSGIINISQECVSLNELAGNLVKEFGNKDTEIIIEKKGNKNKFIINVTKLKKIINE